MPEFSAVDIKTLLIGFVSYTISDFGTEHHLITVHVVRHNIFQYGFEGVFVDQIEVDFVVRGNLNSDIALDIIDKTTHF